MKYVHLLIAGLVLGVECRSPTPSSFREELKELRWNPTANGLDEIGETFPATGPLDYFVDSTLSEPENESEKSSENYPEVLRYFLVSQGRKLEKLLKDFAEKTKESNRLGLLEDVSGDKGDLEAREGAEDLPDFATSRSLEIFQNLNSLKDLVDSVREIDVYYQDGGHVKSRYEDSPGQLPPTQRDPEAGDKTTDAIEEGKKNDAEELDDMLIDLQNRISRMRKHFEKLCRNRHSTVKASDTDRELSASLGSSRPKKISILH